MRDLCPYEVLTAHRHFFLFGFHFLPQGRKFPPLSHYIVDLSFLPRNWWGRGTNSFSTLPLAFVISFEAPPPFVESSALLCKPTRLEVVPCVGNLSFPQPTGFVVQMSANRCLEDVVIMPYSALFLPSSQYRLASSNLFREPSVF